MKIIREHHGFTTNSSASSEWVDLAAKYQQLAREQAAEEAAQRAKEEGLTGDEPAAKQGGEIDGADSANESASPVIPEAPSAPPNPFISNIATLGLIVCSVLGIFALERGVRKYLKTRKAANDDV